jgi:hypothetical protein
MSMRAPLVLVLIVVSLGVVGCRSPYRSDQGALLGGLGGAGLGAIVGNQSGNAGPGAVIGAAAGAITGAVVGNELDEIDARNRAMIEQQMGRSISASAVTINDVMAMTRAGVNDDLIINHVRAHGVAVAPSAQQTIELHQAGVSDRVIKALQTSPPPPVGPPPGPPVIIEEHYYPRPYWPRGYWGGYHYHRRPSWGVGVSVGG